MIGLQYKNYGCVGDAHTDMSAAELYTFLCSCLVTCLKPFGTTFVNKVKLPRMVDTEVYLGDILSFGELTMAFQLVPVLVPERQQSALKNALHHAKAHATTQRVPKNYEVVAESVRQMSKGTPKFPQARALMATHLVGEDSINAEGWAQVYAYIRTYTTTCASTHTHTNARTSHHPN